MATIDTKEIASKLFTYGAALAQKAKALAYGLSEMELKVLEATDEQPWGPHGSVMSEIARAAEDHNNYDLIMGVLDQRLNERDENWRLCYKALLLLEFLVKQGPIRVSEELARSVTTFERLADNFNYKDANGRDQGINVRQRARELATLLSSETRILQEREKANKNAGKYVGVSSDGHRSGGFGSSGFGSSSNFSSGFSSGDRAFGSDSRRTGGIASNFSRHDSPHSPGQGGSGSNFSSSRNGGFGGGSSSGLSKGGAGSTSASGLSTSAAATSASNHKAAAFDAGFDALASSGLGSKKGGSEEENPFEATRKRIERLKQEGGLPEPAGGGGGALAFADASAKATKKLKDVKVNPAFAAAFANISIAPSKSSSSLNTGASTSATNLDLLAGATASTTSSTSVRPTAAVPDLFDALSGPTPAPPPAASSAASLDLFGGPVAASVPATVAADPWGAFGSAAPAAVPAPQITSSAAAVGAPTRLQFDFGAPLPVPSVTPAAAVTPASASAPLSLDLFSESFSVPSAPVTGKPVVSVLAGLPPAPAKDPFADLGGPSTAPKPSMNSAAATFGAFSSAPPPLAYSQPTSAAPSYTPTLISTFAPTTINSINASPPLSSGGATGGAAFDDGFAAFASAPTVGGGSGGGVAPAWVSPTAPLKPTLLGSDGGAAGKKKDPFADLLG